MEKTRVVIFLVVVCLLLQSCSARSRPRQKRNKTCQQRGFCKRKASDFHVFEINCNIYEGHGRRKKQWKWRLCRDCQRDCTRGQNSYIG